jgi:hypothetical protein
LEELLALRDLFVNFAKGLEKYRAGPAASRITNQQTFISSLY